MAEKNSPEYWEKRIAENIWNTYNNAEEKNRLLMEFYQDASKKIRDELYALAEKLSHNGILSLSDTYKYDRLTKLNKRYQDIVKELGVKTEDTARKTMQDGFKQVYGTVREKMGDIDYAQPNKKLMDEMLERPWRGGNFSERLWADQKQLAAGLNDLLLTGLQQGKTATEIAIGLNNLMGKGFNAAHRLVRTETMHYLNAAAVKGYKDSGVKKVQYWAASDERTCDHCGTGGYHRNIYPIDRAPVLPIHPNCRCTYLPVISQERDKPVAKPAKSGILKSGAISGARNPYGKAANEHAKRYYGLVRKMNTDIAKIAKATGIPEKDIQAVKEHLFIKEHDLGGQGKKRFDPDYMIGESWRRLIDGKPEPHDLTLLKHELMERELMAEGLTQDDAHIRTSAKYNYDKEAHEYYGKIKKYKKE